MLKGAQYCEFESTLFAKEQENKYTYLINHKACAFQLLHHFPGSGTVDGRWCDLRVNSISGIDPHDCRHTSMRGSLSHTYYYFTW